jgi:hypothetical protein
MQESGEVFDALVQEFYEGWFYFHPDAALTAGVSGYEDQLPAVDDDDIGALASWLETAITALEELDFHRLDDDRQIELQLLFGACQEEYYALMEQDWRHRDPLRLLPVCALFRLIQTPQRELGDALQRYLEKIPEYLRHAGRQIAAAPALIPPVWLETAISEGKASVDCLLRNGEGALASRGYEETAGIVAGLEGAAKAIRGYLRVLQGEIEPQAAGSLGCGEVYFSQLLRQRHFFPTDAGKMYGMVRELQKETLSEIGALCRTSSMEGPGHWLEHLAAESEREQWDRIEYARSRSRSLHGFLLEHELFEIPSQSHLNLFPAATGCCSSLCASSYSAPSDHDPDLTGSVYFNSSGIDGVSGVKAGITAHTIRNGWPGRHILAVSIKPYTPSGGIIRRLCTSSALTEGWLLYTEQLMFDQGFDQGSDLSLMRLLQRLYRLQLALLDLDVHLHGMEWGEALRRLESIPGVSASQAETDLLHLSRHPADALVTIIGWRAIEALRQIEAGSSLKEFHGHLLESGTVALPLVVQRGFGQKAWSTVAGELGL